MSSFDEGRLLGRKRTFVNVRKRPFAVIRLSGSDRAVAGIVEPEFATDQAGRQNAFIGSAPMTMTMRMEDGRRTHDQRL